ncbi:hypothetical protein [Roseibacillus persicicus]|uniref:hypothetical protein n=1 Tax=Roseibacillus persicicus TaxID=454148 RepID=UPI00280C9E77|nr:hypothetical protein [Roseibacillus persicicus]MDQ8192760.1 hypothetical protein [Roseibacillus persicicus]
MTRAQLWLFVLLPILVVAGLGIDFETGIFREKKPTNSLGLEIEPITIKDAYGMSPDQVEKFWETELTEVEGSFGNLVSKNLHPYQAPESNKLMRYGDSYLVLEFSDEGLVSIHLVSG